jgi:hypothetical protein
MRTSFLAFFGFLHFQTASGFLAPSFQHIKKLHEMQIPSISWHNDQTLRQADHSSPVKIFKTSGRCRRVSATLSMSSEWAAAVDPTSGKTYWYNTKTSQATWDDPTKQLKSEAQIQTRGDADDQMASIFASEPSLPISFVKGTKVMVSSVRAGMGCRA